MNEPAYLEKLERGNIGVLLGRASGDLCSIDIDSDESVEPFLKLNPHLRGTLRTRGRRGCNLWVKVEGKYPKTTKVTTKEGADWGEWRGDGAQTVISGRHPDGMDYKIEVQVSPISITFDQIHWPDNLAAPGAETEFDRLVGEYHYPVKIKMTQKGEKVFLNDTAIVKKFEMERLIIHDPALGSFLFYDDRSGLWEKMTDDHLKTLFRADLFKLYQQIGRVDQAMGIKNQQLNSFVDLGRGQFEQRDRFARPDHLIMHFANGVLDLKQSPSILTEFWPRYYSRNQCPIAFDENAAAPKFEQFLADALVPEDIDLLQKWAGTVLLGPNNSHKIVVIEGGAGSGKTTFASIIKGIIGEKNVAELRTQHLDKQFEISRLYNKRLLLGGDVQRDFLKNRQATLMKKITGGDFLSGELKHGNESVDIVGEFHVLITTNAQLLIRLEDDAGAWARRLIFVPFDRKPPASPIPNFDRVLLTEEGPGIVNWMVKGARDFIANGSKFSLTQKQKMRIDQVLAASDSVRQFVEQCVIRGSVGDALTVEDMLMQYEMFCQRQGWDSVGGANFHRQIRTPMEDIHDARPRNDLNTGTGIQRGYKGFTINCSSWN